jgi:molybdopterin-biosynthesis enzyme MoeA-like protein
MISISDNKQHILILWKTSKHGWFSIITGGLGPTKDDITKKRFVIILRMIGKKKFWLMLPK